VRGNHAALPPVPQSYSQWGAAERAFWQPAVLAPRLEFWRAHLAGAPRIWNIAVSGVLQRCVTQVSGELGRGVRELARRHGATLFSTLLTAFQIALSKWTGADDIVVGTPVANRSTQAARETMGYCSGIVPLRGQIDRTRSFAESLRSVHETTVESFANAIPFAELVRGLGVETAAGHNPLFEVRFALQNHPIPDVAVPGLSLQLRMRSTGTARFNMACEINEEGDAMEVAWLFQPNQFERADIEQVGRMYLDVLAGVCHSPEILTSALMTTLR
jgi:non-ribosomal peptide synthetase component F